MRCPTPSAGPLGHIEASRMASSRASSFSGWREEGMVGWFIRSCRQEIPPLLALRRPGTPDRLPACFETCFPERVHRNRCR